MAKATLVIMAAGIGSRFGGGIKQLEPVGPNGEIIMDYSIYDAMEAGFDKVVFVIRKDLKKDFEEVIGRRIEEKVEVAYAYQELSDIPAPYSEMYQERKKPWGTGQAILCCKDVVKEPFLVINADDYYGKQAYKESYRYLMEKKEDSGKHTIGMVGFVLENTLSDFGAVTRGICKVDETGMLIDIAETKGIEKAGGKAVVHAEGEAHEIDMKSPVSMNMWALQPEFFEVLERGFVSFLENLKGDFEKAEYLLPTIVGDLLHGGQADVTVLKSQDKWFGVTYKEDKPAVVEAVRALIDGGMYPKTIF